VQERNIERALRVSLLELWNGTYVQIPGACRLLLMSLLNCNVFDSHHFCTQEIMIEQPPIPDTPKPPDVINFPGDVNRPVPPGKPEPEDIPGTHPVPPPTDPSPPII